MVNQKPEIAQDYIKIHREPIGTSGIDISGNRYFEEYLTALNQTDGPDEWDKMRRSDDQVIMLLRVVKNPIMSARWFISPADDSEEQKKIADFVQFALFENMGVEDFPKSFEKFKREALTNVEFGYSLFEVTHKVVFDHSIYGTYIGYAGIDWRSPRTIEEWYLSRDGRLIKVRQTDNSERADDVFIPGKFLLHISATMEGDNYEGISLLRPIYGNWIRKDFLNKMKMIGVERAAIGVPIGIVPQGQIKSSSYTEFKENLSRFVSHERQYMTMPEGYKVESFKIEFSGENIQKLIDAENVGMAKSFLANFMELGLSASSSGSYALGTDLSDIFLNGIQVYANAIRDPINLQIIPSLVKLNFGIQEKYPQLKIEGINDKAGKELAEILKLLKEADLIQVTDRLKETIHKLYNFPDFDKNMISAKSDGASPSSAQLAEIEFNLAEPDVGQKITKTGEQMSALMSEQMLSRGKKLVGKIMKIWRNSPKSKRMEQVNRLNVPGKNEYKRIISEILAEIYVRATDGVKKELAGDGLKLAEKSEIRNFPAESKAAGASQADLIVESQDADLRKNLFFSFTSKADTLPTEEQMLDNLINVVNKYSTGASIRTGGPNAVANAVNLARNAIFQQKETLEQIESFIFTNPSPEAAICVELAGRVFTREEYITSNKLPPLHHNCNSWIKAQIAGRPGNKPISPAGLSIQGTDKQIEQIKKSITF